jgi:hypothetical protein
LTVLVVASPAVVRSDLYVATADCMSPVPLSMCHAY